MARHRHDTGMTLAPKKGGQWIHMCVHRSVSLEFARFNNIPFRVTSYVTSYHVISSHGVPRPVMPCQFTLNSLTAAQGRRPRCPRRTPWHAGCTRRPAPTPTSSIPPRGPETQHKPTRTCVSPPRDQLLSRRGTYTVGPNSRRSFRTARSVGSPTNTNACMCRTNPFKCFREQHSSFGMSWAQLSHLL